MDTKADFFKRETKDLSKNTFELWRERIKSNLEWLSKHYWNGWSSWKAAYRLDKTVHWSTKDNQSLTGYSESSDYQVTVPLITSHTRNLLPFLVYRDPQFIGKPAKLEDVYKVKASVAYLNEVWKDQKMTKQLKKAVLDAAIIGHGIIKTGFVRDLEQERFAENPVKDGAIDYNWTLKHETPWMARINPFFFFYDLTGSQKDLNTARWTCEIILKSRQDIIDNSNYETKPRNKLKNNNIKPTTVKAFYQERENIDDNDKNHFTPKDTDKTPSNDVDELLVCYLIFDKKYNRTFMYLAGIENEEDAILFDTSFEHEYLNDFPYLQLDFMEVPNEPYGFGHARFIFDTQRHINRNRSRLYDLSKSWNPIYFYTGPQPLPNSEVEKLKKQEPYETVQIPTGGKLDLAPIPRVGEDLYRADSILSKDYGELTGQDSLARAGELPSRTSAREVEERSRIRALKVEDAAENIRLFALDIGNQIIKHARANLSTDKVVTRVGPRGLEFAQVSTESLKTEFNLGIGVFSKPADSPEAKQEKLLRVLQLATNPNILALFQQAGRPFEFFELWRQLMETFDIDELELAFPGLTEQENNPNVIAPDLGIANTGNNPSISSPGGPGQLPGSQSFDQGFAGAQGLLERLGRDGV